MKTILSKIKGSTFFILSLMLLLSQCKKTTSENKIQSNLFGNLQTKSQECLYVYANSEGGVFVISNNSDTTIKGLRLMHFSASGKFLDTKTIPCNGTSAHINSLSDGGVIMVTNSRPNRLVRIDKNGNIAFNKIFNDSTFFGFEGFSAPVQGDNKHFYITKFKIAVWLADDNTVLEFDENGDYLKNNDIAIQDSKFLGSNINNLFLYKVSNPSIVYYFGQMYAAGRSYFENTTQFVSRFEYNGKNEISKKTVMLDFDNNVNINSSEGMQFLNTIDNNLLLLVNQIEPNSNYIGHIIKVNENLDKVWEMDLRVGIGNTFAKSIRLSSDGGYLVCGDCKVAGKGFNQPFAAKVSSDGKLLWSAIYQMPQYGRFVTCANFFENDYVFAGNTTSFGAGRNQNDMFLIRTDTDGKIKQ